MYPDISISLSLSIYIYIYIYLSMCVKPERYIYPDICVYIYIIQNIKIK